MIDLNIIIPSKPRIVSEDGNRGIYEIEGLYPGYGQTLGNSLRRIILSSMIGTAITMVKIEGASHEFSTLKGVKEDAIVIILNLKKIRFKMSSDEPQVATISIKGTRVVTAGDIETGGQVEVVNPDQVIATLTEKSAEFKAELTLEQGIGYVPKEVLQNTRPPAIGTIILDAAFTPIRRVSYEVENMRVGDRTDYNRLRLTIETDGSVSPHLTLEKSIEIMINQLKAIIGFKEEELPVSVAELPATEILVKEVVITTESVDNDFLKTRIEDLDFSPRVAKALAGASIRTVGGLSRKRESDLSSIDGLGNKGMEEIKEVLGRHKITLKE
ncbi:MAG TPA: DNA-directed RNA polymerase subunit alpha [Candidatus Paceibacterota bacterium]